LAFAPDGRRFLVLEGARTLSLWTRRGRQLKRWKAPADRLVHVDFAPIDNQILATTQKGTLLVMQSYSGTLLHRVFVCVPIASGLHWQSDRLQRWLWVSGCQDGLRIRSWKGWEQVHWQKLGVQTHHGVFASSVSMAGLAFAERSVLVIRQFRDLRPWRAPSSTKIARQASTSKPASEKTTATTSLKTITSVKTITTAPTKTAASGRLSSTKTASSKPSRSVNVRLFAHLRDIHLLRWIPESRCLLSAAADLSVGLWCRTPKKWVLKHLLQHKTPIVAIIWSSHTRQVMTLERSGTLRFWSLKGQLLFASKPPPVQVGSLSFSKRGNGLLSAAEKGRMADWETRSGTRRLAYSGLPTQVQFVHYTADGNHALMADAYNVLFWNIHTRRAVDVIRPPKADRISALAPGFNWLQVMIGTQDNGVYLWTIAGKKILYAHHKPKQISALDTHYRRRMAVVGTRSGRLFLYDMNQHRLRKMWSLQHPVVAVRFPQKHAQPVVLTSRHLHFSSKTVPLPVPSTTLISMGASTWGERFLVGAKNGQIWAFSEQHRDTKKRVVSQTDKSKVRQKSIRRILRTSVWRCPSA
ncbi:MAG: WD40 repeat domain-containing protein, partial [Myxococcota bacterium]